MCHLIQDYKLCQTIINIFYWLLIITQRDALYKNCRFTLNEIKSPHSAVNKIYLITIFRAPYTSLYYIHHNVFIHNVWKKWSSNYDKLHLKCGLKWRGTCYHDQFLEPTIRHSDMQTNKEVATLCTNRLNIATKLVYISNTCTRTVGVFSSQFLPRCCLSVSAPATSRSARPHEQLWLEALRVRCKQETHSTVNY